MSTDRVVRVCALLLSFLCCHVSWPQSVPSSVSAPANDPQAVTLANTAIAALTGGTVIRDVTLTGNVVSGTDSGTATLKAMPRGESRMDLELSGGTRSEVRDAQTGVQLGRWTNPDGTSGYFAAPNCRTDAAWFFPALGSLAGGPNIVLSYIGQETRNGVSVQHLQSHVYQSGQLGSAIQFSTMDFYLDASTLLPVSIAYDVHPDNNVKASFPVEVDFADYQQMGGIEIPAHIRSYQQGSLMLDLSITSGSFNTGLSISIFAIN